MSAGEELFTLLSKHGLLDENNNMTDIDEIIHIKPLSGEQNPMDREGNNNGLDSRMEDVLLLEKPNLTNAPIPAESLNNDVINGNVDEQPNILAQEKPQQLDENATDSMLVQDNVSDSKDSPVQKATTIIGKDVGDDLNKLLINNSIKHVRGENPDRKQNKIPGGEPNKLPGGEPSKLPGCEPNKLPGCESNKLPGGESNKLPGGEPNKLPRGEPNKAPRGKDNISKRNKTDNSRKRSTSRSKYLHGVEVLERKKHILDKTASPYACKIIELPPRPQVPNKPKQKLLIGPKDHRLLSEIADQLVKTKEEAETAELAANSAKNNSPRNTNVPHTISNSNPLRPPAWTTNPVPLKSWPNYCTLKSDLYKTTETQTLDEENNLQYSLQFEPSVEVVSLTPSKPRSTLAQTEIEEVRANSLEQFAENLEVGIFSAAEACSVVIHTVFKESLGNPTSVEGILKSKEFQEFLHSANEIQALEKLAILLRSTSSTIDDYLDTVDTSGIPFPSVTDFSTKSSQALCISSAKSIQEIIKPKNFPANVWSFVPSESQDNFQLSVFFNPETGDIVQTITCKDQIFRTRFSTLPLRDHKVHHILSATRDKIGLPATVQSDRLMDTIMQCSSFAMTRLITSKILIEKCCRKMYEISESFKNKKYSVGSAQNKMLTELCERLRGLNVFVGIVYQMSSEMVLASKCLQAAVWKSMVLQDILKFPRIPGFPNTRLNKDCQLPWGAKIPIDEAMSKLSEGVEGIDHTYRMGQLSLESLEYGEGVKIKMKYKKLLKGYLEGIKYLGSTRDIDFGSLLMNLLCSTELLNHFRDEIRNSDMYDKTAISIHLGKLNWGMVELLGAVKRMESDSQVLLMQTTSRLKVIRDRQKQSMLTSPRGNGGCVIN